MSTLSPESLIIHSFGRDNYRVVHVRRTYAEWAQTVSDANKALRDCTPLSRVEIWMAHHEEEILVWEGDSE